MRTFIVAALAVLALPIVVPSPSEARVIRIVVEQKRLVLDGKDFGDVGPYERVDGTVYFEVDPNDPLNAGIVNLDKAPKTPEGRVGFSALFYILKRWTWRAGTGRCSTGSTTAGTS